MKVRVSQSNCEGKLCGLNGENPRPCSPAEGLLQPVARCSVPWSSRRECDRARLSECKQQQQGNDENIRAPQ